VRGRIVSLLGIAACTAPDRGDTLAPRVDACEGGGGRSEAVGTLAVSVDGVALRPWRAEVLVLPDGDRTAAETFACVLDADLQQTTWAVTFRLPDRISAPVTLSASTSLGVDGFEGTFGRAAGDDVETFLLTGEDATATVTTYDATVGELRGTLDVTATGGTEAALVLSAAYDLRW
jgi:hypothetical protein